LPYLRNYLFVAFDQEKEAYINTISELMNDAIIEINEYKKEHNINFKSKGCRGSTRAKRK
jgi:hypothetical protein